MAKKIEIRDAFTTGDAAEAQQPLFYWAGDSDPHTRVVWNFDDDARRKQLLALRAIRSIHFPNAIATAQPGQTLRHNVEPHIHRKNSFIDTQDGMPKKFYLTDFRDAFGSVDQDVMSDKVDRILGEYGRGKGNFEARRIIGSYIDDGAFLSGVDGIPQGNATSADLLNWYMLEADTALQNMFVLGYGYRTFVATRYLDDLTVSSIYSDGLGTRFRRRVRDIYRYHAPGMEIVPEKSRVLHLSAEHPVLTITGLSLYRDGRITPSRELLGTTREVFAGIAARIAAHDTMTFHDFSVIAGYNGVLDLGGEASRSGSRLVRELAKDAHQLMDILPAKPTL